MTLEQITERHQEITALLDRKELLAAMDKLSVFVAETHDWQLQEETSDITTSYEYMLEYLRLGTDDPQRHLLHNQLLVRAYTLNDKAHMMTSLPLGMSLFHEKRRTYEKMPARSLDVLLMELEYFTTQLDEIRTDKDYMEHRIEELIELARRHESAFTELFYSTWCSVFWSREEVNSAKDILQSPHVQSFVKEHFVTALTFGLLNHLDTAKLVLIADTCRDTDVKVNQRALVGLALICHRYDTRLMLYPEVAARLALLQEEPMFVNDLRTIQVQLLYSRESKKTEQKIKDELLPQFMRNSKIRNDSFHFQADENALENMEKNPDWEEQLRNSGMEKLLSEFQSMMMEGEDVFLASFAQVKNYSFFYEPANWMLPFTTLHSQILSTVKAQSKNSLQILDVITRFGSLCDSDKYSFSLTIAGIPDMQKGMVMNQLSMQEEELKEMTKKLEGDQSLRKRECSKHYIQDFYRFFNLHPRKAEFRNPFRSDLYLFSCRTLETALGSAKAKLPFAEFFFHKELWGEAETLYQKIITRQGATVDVYQKRGFCMQQEMKYTEAIDMYQRADLLNPKQRWVLKNMAYCYRQLGEYEKALHCYGQLKALSSEDSLPLSMQIGMCLLNMGKLNEAMNAFFEAEFMDEQSSRPWRAIAWCSFLSGKMEQSQRYCKRLLQQPSPTKSDYLNAAHTEWVMGNISKAIALYRKALVLYGGMKPFLKAFHSDSEHLIAQGIHEDDLSLFIDILRKGE